MKKNYINIILITIATIVIIIQNEYNSKKTFNNVNHRITEINNNILLRINKHALAIQAVKKIIDNSIDINQEISYKYAEEIVNTANRYDNISISLLTSIFFHESRFNTYAESVDGALGLGQLMPLTMYMICKEFNKNCTDSSAYDYKFNIRATAWYLDFLYTYPKNSKGDIERTVAFYNGGGRQAYRWGMYRRHLNGIPLDSLETHYMNILSNETKEYVHNVIQSDSLFNKIIKNELPING